ncbi:hypothetical protein SAMN04488034_105142 [Salinimicrobium catena]|uniref:Uncharacterized protein n=1 Tax=Salinimicrobium catena TaxID=390640 RepID=A0A1H5NSU7_9FLAO|nr:hypothetical protein SAMN04488140_10519 [Salinimicrobium catena]SEF04504.1 hypothetical protein SAMN04488034_105142 [Salinimicrobium catena]
MVKHTSEAIEVPKMLLYPKDDQKGTALQAFPLITEKLVFNSTLYNNRLFKTDFVTPKKKKPTQKLRGFNIRALLTLTIMYL